jgi:hypothetical protein
LDPWGSGRRALVIILGIGLLVVGLAWLAGATADERPTTGTADAASAVEVRTARTSSGDVEVIESADGG